MSHATGRSARALALASLWAGAALSLGACRDLVAGDASDFGRDLCGELAVCVGLASCDARERLDADGPATPDVVQAYFDGVAGYDCLDSCRDARACRDQAPVCRALGDSCADPGACCGASQRLGRCEGLTLDGEGNCCGERGAACVASQDCCDGELCEEGRCGGVTCLEIGAACTNAFACCSRRCEGGACAPSTCGDVGEFCQGDGDCCAQQTPAGPVPLVCDQGACAAPPDVCVGCEPVNDPARNCCLAQDLRCFEAIDGSSFCAGATCLPTGVACGDDADCCEGVCNQSGVPHCTLPCDEGNEAGCCVPPAGACSADSECCSGGCVAGRCTGVDPGCAEPTCHGPCESGPPLDPLDDACLPPSDVTCVAAVCATQPACCCAGWSLACATEYARVCGEASCTP